MSVLTDHPDYMPHVATADQIAATGAPLLNLANLVTSQLNQSILPGQAIDTTKQTITQPGYEILASLATLGAPAVPFGRLDMLWYDAASGVRVAWESWHMPAGGGGVPFTMYGRGPSRASKLDVQLVNLDGAVTMTGNVYLLQNSRPRDTDEFWYSNPDNLSITVPGFNPPTLVNDNSIAGILNGQAVPASGSKSWLFNMFNSGPLQLTGNTSGPAPSNLTLTVLAQPNSVYTNGAVILRTALTAAPFQFTVNGPRAPLLITWANAATTAATVSMVATGIPY